MRRAHQTALAAVLAAVLASIALAVEPDEMLADPALEARARALDEKIRCVKCQSEAIASSNAEWARDARIVLRELVEAGKSDQEVLDFFVARYGEYVLMRPQTGGSNILLWAAGPLMLLLAGGGAAIYLRGRSRAPAPRENALSEEERERLARILEE